MNWIDIVVGLLMILFLVAGARKGFIREVTGLVGLIVAFILGITGAPFWSKIIVEELHLPPTVATVGSFVLIFTLVFLLIRAVGSLLFKIVHHFPFSLLDRAGGSIVGLLKGGLIISLILLLLWTFPLPQALSRSLNSSILAPPLRALAPAVYNIMKEAFPQMRSLGEVVGQTAERGIARGKEQISQKRSQMLDMLQKTKAASDDGAHRQNHPESN